METAVLTAGFMAFVTEMFAPLLLCSSIPLGSPPVQDPALGRMAPKQCVFYLGWAGMGTPDAKSGNRAERFLADPEIRHMRTEAARRFRLLLKPGSTPGLPLEFSEDAEFWCEMLVTRPCAGYVSHLTQGDNSPEPHGAFVVNVGDARKKVAAMLKRYRKLAKDAVAQRNVDGRIEYRLKTESLSSDPKSKAIAAEATGDKNVVVDIHDPIRLRWTLWDNYLIVVWGDESPAKVVKRMKGPEPGWFAALGKDLPIERRAAILRFDLDAIAAPFAKGDAGQQEIAKQIKDTHLRAVTLVTGLGQEDFVSRVLVETDGVAGSLLKTMADRPLKTEDMAVIPRDATLAMALRVNPDLIGAGLQWLNAQAKEADNQPDAKADKSEGDQTSSMPLDATSLMMSLAMSPGATAQQAIGRICKKPIATLNDELCTELTASIDDAWRLYTSPGEGSSIFNGMTGVVHVKDARRLTKLFDKLVARKPGDCPSFRLSENGTVPFNAGRKPAQNILKNDQPNPETWAVRKTCFADHDVYYMVRAQGESAGVLTWCLVKDELVCSLSPQNVKAYLLRQPGGSSLADEPAVIEALRDKQSPTLLVYEDSRAMFRLTYPLMQGWAMVVAAQGGLPTDGIDPMLLPASPTIAKYLRPAVSTVSVVPKGAQLTIHQSLPNGNLGATLYCVLCSLLPANAETFAPTAGIPMVLPAYTADPPKKTPEFVLTPDSNSANAAPACVPSDAAQNAYGSAPPSSYAPAPAGATAAPCVPGPTYPSTSAPESCRPAYSMAPQIAAAAPSPYSAAPLPSASYPYATPYGPATPPNPNTPPGYAAPVPSNSAVLSAPAGYRPVVVYVPMVYYVPITPAVGGYPPPVPLPAVYAPPSYTPPSYPPPSYAPPPPPPPSFAPPTAAPMTSPMPQSPGYAPSAPPNNSGWDPYGSAPPASSSPSVASSAVSSLLSLLPSVSAAPSPNGATTAAPVPRSAGPACPWPTAAAPAAVACATPPTFAAPVAVVPQSSPPAAAHRIFTEEEGPCTLKKRGGSDKDIFKVEVGKKLHGVFRFYVEDSADGPHITTDVSVENATKTDQHFRYEITFLDKSGEPINFFPKNVSGEGNLVGRGAACNRETCSLLVPDGTSETVASYKVRFYETDKMPAKKR